MRPSCATRGTALHRRRASAVLEPVLWLGRQTLDLNATACKEPRRVKCHKDVEDAGGVDMEPYPSGGEESQDVDVET